MGTKITEKVIINAPGQDIVLDGLDFTAKGYIEVSNVKSLTLINCRVYGMTHASNTNKNYFLRVLGDIPIKLVVKNNFFGDNPMSGGSMYNIIEPTAVLQAGSEISNNYFTENSCTHNHLSIYGIADGATVKVNGNVLEKCAGSIRIGTKGEPKGATVEFANNKVLKGDTGVSADYQGLVCVQSYGKKTVSFAGLTIDMKNNSIPGSQKIYAYNGSNDTPITTESAPKLLVNGAETPITIKP